jgi:adenylosuccinate lyase
MENISLWHERDISHSSTERIIFPDACLVLDYMLSIFLSIMDGLKIHPDRMQKNVELTKGLIFSQRVLIALIDKGLTRQKAYELVQRNAMKSWKEKKDFLGLLQSDAEVIAQISQSELESIFDYNQFLQHIDSIFLRLGLS